VGSSAVALLEQVNSIFVPFLLDSHFRQIPECIVVPRENCECLLQRVICFGDLSGHKLQMPDLAINPGSIFRFVRRSRLQAWSSSASACAAC
jgi:hypothetical protein